MAVLLQYTIGLWLMVLAIGSNQECPHGAGTGWKGSSVAETDAKQLLAKNFQVKNEMRPSLQQTFKGQQEESEFGNATCKCTTPNKGAAKYEGAAGHNKFKCTNGKEKACSSKQICHSTKKFEYGKWSRGCHVGCKCTRPHAHRDNEYKCTDGTEQHCAENEICYARGWFKKGKWTKGCKKVCGLAFECPEHSKPDPNKRNSFSLTFENCCLFKSCDEFPCKFKTRVKLDKSWQVGDFSQETCCESAVCEGAFTCPSYKSRPNPEKRNSFSLTFESCCLYNNCEEFPCKDKTRVKLDKSWKRWDFSQAACCERKTCEEFPCRDKTRVKLDKSWQLQVWDFSQETCCENVR